MNSEKGYFGSVQFFKHMLLILVLVLIAIPTIFAIVYKNKYNDLKRQVDASSQVSTDEKGNIVEETKARVITITGANGETITMVVDDSEDK